MTTPGSATLAGDAQERRRRLVAALQARRAGPALLAPNQERLVALQQLDPSSTAYSEPVVLRLRGALQVPALVTALRALPGRHEWLRSRIEHGPDGPLQVLDDGPHPVVVDVVDLSAVPGPGHQEPTGRADRLALGEGARAWVDGLVRAPLPLDGPLWRAGLAVLGPEDHLLVLVVHHVACDATSLGVLLEELGERYDAELRGTPVDLPRPPSPRELSGAVRALQSSVDGRQAVERHADALAAADVAAQWPVGAGSGATVAGPAPSVQRRVPAPLLRRLRRTANEQGSTPFAVVSAAVAAALADALDVRSPVLGVPVDLRWHLPGSDETVSFLVETLAVALPQVRDLSLAEAAGAVRDAVADGLQQPPRFDEVVSVLRRRGVLPVTGTPVQSYVSWVEAGAHAPLGDLGPAVTHVDLALTDPKFDLAWTAVHREQSLDLRLEYDGSRLARSEAEQLLEQVLRLLEAATSAPDVPLGQLELLGTAELDRLRRWEGVPGATPVVDLLGAVLAGLRSAATEPVLLDDQDTVTGAELLARVDRLAAALLSAGVGPGVRVAVPGHRSTGMVVRLLAVLRAGGTYLPLDPTHPSARQKSLARAARVGAVVGASAWARPLAGSLGVPTVATDDAGHPDEAAGTLPAAWPGRTGDDLAYVMFTSGSTGRPKAVRVPDRAVVARVESYREVLADAGVRYLLQSSLTFDASTYLFWVLATGGRLVVPSDTQAGDPSALADLVARHGVTDAFFVPPVHETLLQAAPPGSLDTLRRVCVGGDVMPPAVAALHHDVLPGTRLLNVYGPTEVVTTAVATVVTPADLAGGRAVPIGRPHPGTVARVVDRYGRRVAPGVVGELHLGGPSVADGYDAPPAEDVPGGPFYVHVQDDAEPVRWYRTGDLVRWDDDGRLEFVGRRDRQVKLRGQRVELGEVEAAVRALPDVRDAAVEVLGEADRRRLVAVVVARQADRGADLEARLRGLLAEVLPEAWLPDLVLAVAELPRSSSGKLDRDALRSRVRHCSAPARSPEPLTGPEGPASGALRPASLTERTVLSLVQGLLADDEVRLDDDFFAVGGNSLLAARLVGQLNAVLGVALPLHELASHPTVRGIATLVEGATGRLATAAHETARLVPVRRSGTLPPVVLVARDGATSLVLLHALSRMEPDRPVWTLLRPMPELGVRPPDLREDAAAVAQLLVDQLPAGPLHVLGHSASGLVAMETARALGDRSGVTVLLDTLPPSTWHRPGRRLGDLARIVVRGHRLRRLLRRTPDGTTLDPADVRALRNYQDTVAAYRMRLTPLDHPVTLLTTDETRDATGCRDLGWGRWLPRLRVLERGGGHHDLLVQPEVTRTAQLLAETLRG